MSESVQTLEHEHHAVEIEREGLFIHLGRRRIRLEYLLLAGMLLLALGFGALFIALDLGKDDLERWGYAGLFGIVVFRSASVVLPMPGGGVIFAVGGLLNPVFGIPAPVAVGLALAGCGARRCAVGDLPLHPRRGRPNATPVLVIRLPQLPSQIAVHTVAGAKDYALGARGSSGADAATGELPADGLAVAARDGRTRLRDAEIVDGASTLPDEAITECADRVQASR